MTVRETFIELYQLSHDKANIIWGQEFVHCNPWALDELKGIEMEMQSREDRENFMQTSKAYLEGLLRAKNQAAGRLMVTLNFLQFIHATEVVRMCNSNGLFSDSHDWLEFSLCDTLTPGQRYLEPDRIKDFLESSDKFIVLNRTNDLLFWMGELQYVYQFYLIMDQKLC